MSLTLTEAGVAQSLPTTLQDTRPGFDSR